MDILKTPHEKLLEEAGAVPATPGMVHTPQQMLMQESGVMPHFAQGGDVSSFPDVSFDVRNIPSMSGMPGVGYQQDPQGAIARMQLEQQLKNKARLRAGVSGLGMSIPGQHGVKMMPDQMDVGVSSPVGPGYLNVSANRSINPIPGRGHIQGINAKYSVPFAEGGSVQDMIAELIQQGHLPQHFATGGSALKNIGTQAAFSLPFIPEDAQSIAKAIKQKQYPEAAVQTAGVGYSAFAPFNPLTALLSGMTYSPEVGDATLDAYLAQREAAAAPKQHKPTRPAERHNIIPFTETSFYKK